MVSWKQRQKKIKNDLIFVTVKFAFRFINRVKRKTAFTIFTSLGRLAYYIAAGERAKTERHLAQVFGRTKSNTAIKQMAQHVFINLARNMVDAFRIGTMDAESIDEIVKVIGLENLDAALEKGNGALALTGHIGNWELIAAYLAFKGYPLHVIGAPIYDSRLDEMVVNNRTASGAGYIARGGATREILRVLRRNGVIGILMDQDSIKNDGIFIDFLGTDAYTPIGPVMLAMKTGAAIVPIACHIRHNNTHFIEAKPALPLVKSDDSKRDVYENTLMCSKAIEDYLLASPTQWVWMHERWKTKPSDLKS